MKYWFMVDGCKICEVTYLTELNPYREMLAIRELCADHGIRPNGSTKLELCKAQTKDSFKKRAA